MKKFWILMVALGLCGRITAMGISPDRAENSAAVVQTDNGLAQLQPAPQPSNLLAPGQQGMPGGRPMPPPSVDEQIKNYVPDDWAKAWGHIHLAEAEKMHKDPGVLFVDARAKAEYDQGHIPGAIPLPLGEFDQYFKKYQSKIKRAKHLVTYCHGANCKLSDKVAQKLYNDKKFHNVSSFFGGWPQWQEHNLPVEVGPEPKSN